MCGRYIHPDTAAIESYWAIGRRSGGPFALRYNVTPTSVVPILRHTEDGLELAEARWSFVPHWWKQAKAPAMSINARSEEAAAKPMWRDAYRSGKWHVAIPGLAWYEWQARERVDSATGEVKAYKQPSVLRRADAQPFCFAGLQSWWTPPDGGTPQRTCAILTRAAPASIASVHDRAPIVLPDELVHAWLDPALQGAPACEELLAHAQTQFVHFPVRTLVNSAKAEGPELVEPIALQ